MPITRAPGHLTHPQHQAGPLGRHSAASGSKATWERDSVQRECATTTTTTTPTTTVLLLLLLRVVAWSIPLVPRREILP